MAHIARHPRSWRPTRRALLAGVLAAALPWPVSAQDDATPSVDAPVELGPGEAAALALINRYREAAGVPPAEAHPALIQAAVSHVNYYDANRGGPIVGGQSLHDEHPEAPGFTGERMGDRARAAGYSHGGVTENAGFGPLEAAVEWYMGTVNHRLPLIHPSAIDIGLARSTDSGFGIIDVGLRGGHDGLTLPSVFPPNGANGVPTTWDGLETPDPAPGLPRPLGYPLTVAFSRGQNVEWRQTELHLDSGEPVEVSTPRTDWMRALAMVPHRPLDPGRTYVARVQARADDAEVERTWTFTTRA